MKRRQWIGLGTIGALALIVLAIKGVSGSGAPAETPSAVPVAAAPTTPSPPAAPASSMVRVILFADPREAEASCGCGDVIRAVRAAAARGVVVEEVDPDKAPDLLKRYRVTVAPTVVITDDERRELRRHVGESGATIAALRQDMDGLAGGVR